MKPKRTILCVDDSEQCLSIMKIMLETRGYRVLACGSAHDAMKKFRQGGVDLLLTEIVGSAAEGAALIDTVKNLSPETPVILSSSKVKVFNHGTRADAFLPRNTCAPADLLEQIRLMLVRKRGPKKHHRVGRAALPAIA